MARIEIIPRNLPAAVEQLAQGVDEIFVHRLGEDFRTHGLEIVRRMQTMEPGKPISFELPRSAAFVRALVDAHVPRDAVVSVKVDGVSWDE